MEDQCEKKTLFERLQEDVRFVEGMKACFNCGTCTSPKSINDTITDARSAAAQITSYLKGYKIAELKIQNSKLKTKIGW
jgi:heterodisulfide reductase subunit A-like polyferredoxin